MTTTTTTTDILSDCRAALARMSHRLDIPLRTVPAAARKALMSRGLIAEHTKGYVAVTHRGEGFAAAPDTFEL